MQRARPVNSRSRRPAEQLFVWCGSHNESGTERNRAASNYRTAQTNGDTLTATLADQLELCDTLRAATLTANALDGKHAVQWGGTYGAVADALVKALTVTLESQGYGPRQSVRIARAIYDACIDSGDKVGMAESGHDP